MLESGSCRSGDQLWCGAVVRSTSSHFILLWHSGAHQDEWRSQWAVSPALIPWVGRETFSVMATASMQAHNLFGALFFLALTTLFFGFGHVYLGTVGTEGTLEGMVYGDGCAPRMPHGFPLTGLHKAPLSRC